MYQIKYMYYLIDHYLKVLDHTVNWCSPFAWKNGGKSCSLLSIIFKICSSNIFFNIYQND